MATTVERSDATTAAIGCNVPSIAMLVNEANIPPAGVKPPYIHDWKAAASVPKQIPDDQYVISKLQVGFSCPSPYE